jgi:uncharacterized protein
MAAAAMPLEELERWLQARVDRRHVATDVPMLDGYVTAIVAGPASISPLDKAAVKIVPLRPRIP